jgi:hypothetical protein
MVIRPNPRDADAVARRARYSLYLLGAIFVTIGFSLEMVPVLADATPWWSGRASAFVGAVCFSIGRFASDRFVRQCDALLSRRPFGST